MQHDSVDPRIAEAQVSSESAAVITRSAGSRAEYASAVCELRLSELAALLQLPAGLQIVDMGVSAHRADTAFVLVHGPLSMPERVDGAAYRIMGAVSAKPLSDGSAAVKVSWVVSG